MAYVIDEVLATRSAGFEAKKQGKLLITARKFSRTYYVIGSLDETEEDVASAAGIPQIGFPLLNAVCKGISPKEIDQIRDPLTGDPGMLWEVECAFDNTIDEEDAQNQDDESTMRPRVRWSSATEDTQLERDAITGAPIQTPAGEPLLVIRPYPVAVLEVTRWGYAPYDPRNIFLYTARTNSTAFYGVPTGTALMESMTTGEEKTINRRRFVEENYTVKFKLMEDPSNLGSLASNTWVARPVNQGQMYKSEVVDPIDGNYFEVVRAVDKDGNPIMFKLALDGTKLPDDAEETYLEFNKYAKANFNNLNLGPF